MLGHTVCFLTSDTIVRVKIVGRDEIDQRAGGLFSDDGHDVMCDCECDYKVLKILSIFIENI